MAASSTNNNVFQLLNKILKILKEEHVFDRTGDHPVVRFVHPENLQKEIPLSLDNEPANDEEIEMAVRQTIRYSVKTSNPHFHNQLYAGIDEYGLAGAWLTDVLNTSQYTYEVAPVFTLMEREVIEKSLALVGYPPMPQSDGVMNPGGSMSNMYGMVLARYRRFPEVKKTGVSQLPALACFSSECHHYSIMKGAHWLGLGTDNVYKVKTDELGRMIPSDLKRAIQEAKNKLHLPFFVNATCGTTVLGAIDPLMEIAVICQSEGLWLHVDACYGGTLLLSEKYRHRLRGIELFVIILCLCCRRDESRQIVKDLCDPFSGSTSNSVSWNPHKMLGVPLQCSVFLVKDKNVLQEANCAQAKYLFQKDKFYDVSWDTGDKSVQCGRKVDAMKFWLMWKARGTQGLARSVDRAMSCTEYFLERIKNILGFRLVLPDYECSSVCFWYVPPCMRGQEETEEWWKRLSVVTTKIKEYMILDGCLMIGYTPLSAKNLSNFFRMVVSCQPPPTKSSMDYAISQIEKYGTDSRICSM